MSTSTHVDPEPARVATTRSTSPSSPSITHEPGSSISKLTSS